MTVVLPVLNERAHIRDCLASLLAQDSPDLLEIVVADGGSTDGTPDLASSVGSLVRVINNPGITAASGLNCALSEAKGEVIVRGDAHTLYAPDYVRRCVDVLLETGAANVGGPMRPVGTTSFGRAVAAVTSSPFGVGPGRFHYSRSREEADTVYLGCWWRTTLESLGGFDQSALQWGAEDHELNFRLARSGGKIVLDPDICSWYFPRETPRRLARQYFNYGVGKASTLAKHRRLPTWRPLAPAILVVATAGGLVGLRGWRRGAVPLVHGLACGVVSLRAGRDPGVAPHRAMGALEICHWAYGLGFLVGLSRWARGRGFNSSPRGHR